MVVNKKHLIAGGIISVGFLVGLIISGGSKQSSIVKAKDGNYQTKNTSFTASFAGKKDPTKVIFKKDGAVLIFNLPYENIEWKKDGDKLIADVGNGRAYSYSLIKDNAGRASGLKEEIILKNPGALANKNLQGSEGSLEVEKKAEGEQNIQNQFQFTISLEGLTPKKGKDGLWHFFNDDGKELFYIPKPYMEDASGVKSENVEIDIQRNSVKENLAQGKTSEVPKDLTSQVGELGEEGKLLTITVDKNWLMSPERKYPIKIDPTLQLTVLTVHSHPQQGDDWVVDFETEGKADLKIIPDDQATIEDDEFVSLTCGDKEVTPQILEDDVIHVPNWECNDKTATVTHKTLKAGKHTLRFEFGGQTVYAYNDPGTSTYNFVNVTQSTNDFYAYEDYGASIFSGPDDTGTSEATDTDYSNIASDDGARWESANASSDGDYDAQLYKFFIDESESDVTQLDLKWNGYGETESGYSTYFYIWDYNSSAWEQLASSDFTSAADADLTGTIDTSPENYIDTDGEVVLMAKTKYVEPDPCDPMDCTCDGTGYETLNCANGDTVYVDCNADKCWSPTSASQYPWSLDELNASSCVGQGSDFEACHYCDTLDHGGKTDWYLPDKTILENLCNSGSCSGTCFGGDGENESWSSTEYDSENAYFVIFNGCEPKAEVKGKDVHVRCVR
jgi:hypothetical protein